jgi:hypothetical protein
MGAIRPGSGGGGGSVTAASIAAAITSAADAETVRAATGQRVIDPLSGSGWTTLSAGTGKSVTWTAGTSLRLSIDAGTAGLIGVSKSGFLPDAEEYDLCLRLDIAAGDPQASAQMVFRVGASSSSFLGVHLYGNGQVSVLQNRSGTTATPRSPGAVPTPPAGIDAAARTGGQMWLRFSHRVGRFTLSWGTGTAGALPTGWELIYATPESGWENAIFASAGQYVEFNLYAPSPLGVTYTLDLLAIRATGQTAGVL